MIPMKLTKQGVRDLNLPKPKKVPPETLAAANADEVRPELPAVVAESVAPPAVQT